MSSEKLSRDERQNFMAVEGFVLYNDTTDQVLDSLAGKPLPTLRDCETFLSREWTVRHEVKYRDCLASSAGLYVVGSLLAEQVPSHKTTIPSDRAELFELTEHEQEQVGKYTWSDGLDELNFPWVFSTALASTAMHEFIEADIITKDEANKLELPDWADIIGSKWFGSLNRTLAHTGFGTYGGRLQFGSFIGHHTSNALAVQLNNQLNHKYKLPHTEGRVLTTETSTDGFRDARAVVTEPFRSKLTKALLLSCQHELGGSLEFDFGDSIGCPVGRHATVLPPDYAASLPRALELEARGNLSIADHPDINGNFPATQKQSAIDRNLAFIADQLRRFHAENGTPDINIL